MYFRNLFADLEKYTSLKKMREIAGYINSCIVNSEPG